MEEDMYEPTNEVVLLWWNEMAKENNLITHRKIPSSLWDKFRKRYKEGLWEEKEELERKIKQSPFLGGKNDRGWRMDFEFLVRNDKNWLKIMDGKYQSQTKGFDYIV